MQVILVNEKDEEMGAIEKLEAHQLALLHRAFSIFILNGRGEMLLHKRAACKYHSAGLWSNACCSHPQPGEEIGYAATKRLQEEMGFTTALNKAFDFIYKVKLDNEMTEYEFDHVFIGTYEGKITPDSSEVSDYCYKTVAEIKSLLLSHPQKFTAWFKIAFPKVEEYLAVASLK